MDTPNISAEPIDGYLESCYAAFLRGDPRPELPPEIEVALVPDARGRIDEAVERLRRRAEARRRRRQGRPTTPAGPLTGRGLKVPGYDITGVLGEGGFGRVYRAISRRDFGVPVALKVLRPPSPQAGPEAPGRRLLMTRLLIGEARVLAHIGHRNVVRYLGSGIIAEGPEAGTPFIATELIDGPTLAERIGAAPQDPRWSAQILVQVADALDFVHQLKLQRPTDGDDDDPNPSPGILHRDVKPSNILLGRGDQPLLTDFGLAGRAGRTASDEGFVAGTAAYSAPEQLRADAVLTPAVDVYGLGATLHHLLAGKPPQFAPIPADRDDSRAGMRLTPPRRWAPRIPADLERICLRCLEEDPSRRYPTAGAVRDDLKRFLEGRPVSIHPVGPWGRAVRWARHSPLVATLATSFVLAIAIGLLATSWFWRQARAERLRAENAWNRGQAEGVRADSERRTADAGLELADDILEVFAESSSNGVSVRPAAYSGARLVPILRRGRQQLLALVRRRPDDPTVRKWLAGTDLRLAAILINDGGQDEARSLLAEAREVLEQAAADAPKDSTVLTLQRMNYDLLAELAGREGKDEDCVDYLARRIAILERMPDQERTSVSITNLAELRTGLGMWLARSGDVARARSLLEANVRTLDNDPRGASEPAVAIYRVFAHEDLRQLGASGRTGPTGSAAVPGMDPLSRLISPQADRLSAEDWASLLVQFHSVRPTSRGVNPVFEAVVVECFFARLAERRRFGRLEEARRLADRLHAFGRQLVARYPDRAAAHWTLSHAYIQIHKNAYKTGDRAAVEKYLRLAVDESRRALILDPDNAVVRHNLADWQERLDKLLSPPKSVDALSSAARPPARNSLVRPPIAPTGLVRRDRTDLAGSPADR